MKVKCVEDTDTLYIEFSDNAIAACKDLDENTILDVDGKGNICAITFEHASQRTDVSRLTVEGIAVQARSRYVWTRSGVVRGLCLRARRCGRGRRWLPGAWAW